MSQRAYSNDRPPSWQQSNEQPASGQSAAGKRGVLLTAGAAGMFCGSCMHDNAIARALRQQGIDCLLQPIYTPIRVDGESVATDHLFFGGIHVYLLQRLPWLRHIPAPLRRMLDWPPLLRWATSRSISTDAAGLGEMAVSMLQGSRGRQRDEVVRLADWLANEVRADTVVLSNLLIGGVLPELRRRMPAARLVVILQGDDIFLDHLPEDARARCVSLCRELARSVDKWIVNSRFYAEKMGQLLEIPTADIEIMSLSIDTSPFNIAPPHRAPKNEFRIGYLARIAPEKGFHRIVEAFIKLATRTGNEDLTLHAAGWLGESNKAYLQSQLQQIADAGLQDRFSYHGSPELTEKIAFLHTLDLLSVPTDYEDPKGLFVLESLAAGVPVIQPDHGSFAELIEATGGGVIVTPKDTDALAEAIQRLKDNPDERARLAALGRQRVFANHSIESAARAMQRIMFE